MGSRKSGNIQELSKSFDVLSFLDTSELKQLLNDDTKLDDLIKDNPVHRELHRKKEDLIMENRSLADYSLSLEKKLEEAKLNLQHSHCMAAERSKELEQKRLQKGGSSSKFDPDTLLAVIQACATESEEESDKMAEQFVAGFSSIEEFLEKFLKKRTEAHVLRTKVEKLSCYIETGSLRGGNYF